MAHSYHEDHPQDYPAERPSRAIPGGNTNMTLSKAPEEPHLGIWRVLENLQGALSTLHRLADRVENASEVMKDTNVRDTQYEPCLAAFLQGGECEKRIVQLEEQVYHINMRLRKCLFNAD